MYFSLHFPAFSFTFSGSETIYLGVCFINHKEKKKFKKVKIETVKILKFAALRRKNSRRYLIEK